MKSKPIKSAVYAAGLVFAPSEDAVSTHTLTPRAKAKSKRSKRRPAVDYEAAFVRIGQHRREETTWLRSLDLSWLLGRATA
jgi:hypothetical protein